MASTFVVWPQQIDDAFRVAYANEVQEIIAGPQPETADRTRYFCGSSRLTAQNRHNLDLEFPGRLMFLNEPPQEHDPHQGEDPYSSED